MAKGFTAAVGITIVAGLALGVGLGMYQSGSLGARPAAQMATAGQPASSTGRSAAPAGQADQESAGIAARGVPGVAGTVESLAGQTLTLTTPNGPIKVMLTADTAIRKTAEVKPADLAKGETVTVLGVRAADGTVAARSVQAGVSETQAPGEQAGSMRPVGQAGRTMGQQPATQGSSGQAGQQGQGGLTAMVQVVGTLESVATDRIGVKTASGSTTVTLSDQTTLRRTVPGTQSDLAQGVAIMAGGQQGADGALTAIFIQIGADFGQPGRIRQGQGP